ncbi:histone deacetylase [Sphingomonas koreensis]|uniref:Histone deacetylase n=1 Tax=Sphingomonas koreensis TaxID=93064 RepID=A0A1L6JGN2_9SPHN|nr:histone deacetylase [Sphingomonas koreensis]APR55074.1 histone deacetylase [Sphingomonas koreensis]MDC7809715.1 histone deacetylase [Sphingomonas koreensis]PJI87102.1 acetoin utilization deacetylase AcuC-like enzyme [Sphingomonas koreensis]RSU21053.1 histone deacetylase [Sphingomonas koreensis]RSU22115.1 histone deacetylase [Sphingomonas koreensis]
MPIPVVHHPLYVAPAPARSQYQWNKNGLVRDLLRDSSASLDWHEPEPMPRAWIEAVHDPDYVAEVIETRVPREKERRIGFPVTEAVALRALAVPGGTYLAAKLAQRHGFAANTAGGSHHALHDTGAGYCVFNDLAIAANRLAEEGERVLIVDCDVHQGDGTAALMAGRGDVATYSIHAEKNFPVRKARSTLDVGLPDGTDDVAYMDALTTSLPALVEDFAPTLILYQAGVDPWEGDRLGRLKLSREGLVVRDKWVASLARARGVPLASALGGGYGVDAMEVSARHVASILALGGG